MSGTRRTFRQRRTAVPRGLWNAGQTCHLGASVTALSAAPSFKMWLRKLKIEPNSSITKLRNHLLEASASYERYGLDPRPLLHILEAASGWKSRHAQDAHETLARMLDILEHVYRGQNAESDHGKGLSVTNLHSALIPNTRCFALQIGMSSTMMPFSMVTSSSRRCCSCGDVSETTIQQGSTVMLPVPSKMMSLASLLVSSQISKEIVEMRCEKCGAYGEHWRITDIERLPQVLIVHLHRAIFVSGYTKSAEVQATIPLVMDIPQGRSVRGKLNTRRYSLRSVVRHWNGAGGQYGHFDCIIRQDIHQGLAVLSERASWWHVDDDKVRPSTAAHACQPGNVYLVVYEMKDSN